MYCRLSWLLGPINIQWPERLEKYETIFSHFSLHPSEWFQIYFRLGQVVAYGLPFASTIFILSNDLLADIHVVNCNWDVSFLSISLWQGLEQGIINSKANIWIRMVGISTQENKTDAGGHQPLVLQITTHWHTQEVRNRECKQSHNI